MVKVVAMMRAGDAPLWAAFTYSVLSRHVFPVPAPALTTEIGPMSVIADLLQSMRHKVNCSRKTCSRVRPAAWDQHQCRRSQPQRLLLEYRRAPTAPYDDRMLRVTPPMSAEDQNRARGGRQRMDADW